MKKLVRITTVPLSLNKLLGEQLRYMNQFYEVIAISSDEENLKKTAKKFGVKYHAIPMTRQITPLQDLWAIWQLYRFLKTEKPEIVHSHTPKAGLVAMMAAYFAGVPVRLHTVAGLPLLEISGTKRKVLNWVEKLTYACATKVYPNSQNLEKIIIQQKFCNPEKLKVIGNGSSNGIDLQYFSPTEISTDEKISLKQKLGISDEDFVFVFVGRLVKDKGINELVAAFEKLQKENSEVKLLLVGPLEQDLDPLKPETLAIIENNSAIISGGYQEDVRAYFAISDALVFPSYREGFPNVVLQALAMELPAIVTNINGCNEIVIHGENGVLISPKNVEELQKEMLNLLQDQELYHFLKKNARDSIIKFDRQLIWDGLLEEYDVCFNTIIIN